MSERETKRAKDAVLVILGLALWLSSSPEIATAQSVKLPAEIKGDPGSIVVIVAETDCPSLRWVVLDPGMTQIPPELLKDSRAAVLMASKPGRYRVLAYGALKDLASHPAICVVVIGNPGPVPPPPVPPGPDPVPPDPVPPVPPIPNDPLAKEVYALYAADGGLAKAAKAAELKRLYEMGVGLADDGTISTGYALFKRMKDASAILVPADLKGVRERIAKHLDGVLSTKIDAPLTNDLRIQCKTEFRRLAAILGGCR